MLQETASEGDIQNKIFLTLHILKIFLTFRVQKCCIYNKTCYLHLTSVTSKYQYKIEF